MRVQVEKLDPRFVPPDSQLGLLGRQTDSKRHFPLGTRGETDRSTVCTCPGKRAEADAH